MFLKLKRSKLVASNRALIWLLISIILSNKMKELVKIWNAKFTSDSIGSINIYRFEIYSKVDDST